MLVPVCGCPTVFTVVFFSNATLFIRLVIVVVLASHLEHKHLDIEYCFSSRFTIFTSISDIAFSTKVFGFKTLSSEGEVKKAMDLNKEVRWNFGKHLVNLDGDVLDTKETSVADYFNSQYNMKVL